MRMFLACLAGLVVCACSRPSTTPAAATGCVHNATHEVSWSSASAPDVITTRAEGPSCAQAVVTFVARNAQGDPLWAFASTYTAMTMGDAPLENAPPVTAEQLDTFLANWANVTLSSTNELPEWREGAATLTESAHTFAYTTPFDRDVYEMLRAQNLTMICLAIAVEGSQCLIIDPANHAPSPMVAYGP